VTPNNAAAVEPLRLSREVEFLNEGYRAALGGCLPQQGLELVLHQRVQPRRRLVEHQQLRTVQESQHQADLLPAALRQLAHRTIDHHLEPAGQPAGQILAG
jgi:hypothetical protein